MRREIHPEGSNAPWWRLDEVVRANRRHRIRKAGLILGGLAVITAVLYFGLRLLFPVDPKVAEASRRTGAGDQLIQGQADFPGALAEYEQAAELTPDDPEVWLRVGAVQEKTGDAAAEETYARVRALVPDDVAFQQMRASVYLLFGMIERAEQDLQAAVAAKPEDPITWYELASVFESRGELRDAIGALERVDRYAAEAELVELSAMARYRLGILMQQAGYQQQSEPAGVATP